MTWSRSAFAAAWRDLHPVTSMLVALVVVVGCIPLAAALALYLLHSKAEISEAEVNARRTAALLVRSFEQSVEQVDGLLQGFITTHDRTWTPLQVHNALKAIPVPASVLQLAVVDRNGHFVANNLSPPTGELLDISKREHVRIHMEADKGSGPLFISKPVIGSITKRWNILLERVLDDGTGHFGGLVAASYAIADFINFYKQLRVEDGMLIALVGDDGVVRARAGAQTSFGDDVSESAVFAAMKRGTSAPYHGTSPLDGVERVGYVIHSERYPFMVLVAYSMDYIEGQTTTFRTAIWGTAAGLAVALLIVGLLAGRYVHLQNALRARELQALARQREAHVLEAISRVPGISVMHVAADGPAQIGGAGASGPLSRLVGAYLRSAPFRARAADLQAPLHSVEHLSDGESEREVELVVAPLTEIATEAAPDGGPRDVVVFAVDQTSRRMEENKLYQLSKLASLGEVATGLAHEINQPLGVIRLAAANALAGIRRALPAEHVESKLNRIIQQTVRMSRIIDHMRIFGRPSDERLVPTSALDAIDGALQVVGAQLHLEDVEVSIVRVGEVPQVLCRQDQLEQVIINLLQNARDAIHDRRQALAAETGEESAEASPEGGAIPGRITLTVATETGPMGAMVRIDVGDDAGGIAPEILDRVFQPFFTTKPPGKGTGLGLSVSFGIIRDHGGSISVANGPNGAIFTVRLPAVPAAAQGETLAAE